MKKLFYILILLNFSLSSTAQNCNCEAEFDWIKNTFQENDAGFEYGISLKDEEYYNYHTQQIIEKAKQTSNFSECQDLIHEWLLFFRKGHHGIELHHSNLKKNELPELSNKEIIQSYKDSESYYISEVDYKNYINGTRHDSLEDIWIDAPYEIGIMKVDDYYVGFIIKADNIYWKPGQIKFKIHIDSKEVTYFMKNHSVKKFETANLLGENYLEMGFITFKRKTLNTIEDTYDKYFKQINAIDPFIEVVNENTLLLRIPSFSYSEKTKIDDLMQQNTHLFSKYENLIIDLRNNSGGSDDSYKSITPLIYTNLYRCVGVQLLSTELNNSRRESFSKDSTWNKEDRKWAKTFLIKLQNNIGNFVNNDTSIVRIEKLDTIYEFPKKIGIIINEGCASTSEQFLLMAKQSQKVKLFGTTTYGALDISNMYNVKSPSGNYTLWYSLSKSFRIPSYTIDSKGIQPDYYIDSNISKYNWVNYIQRILNTY